ncbi:MAG: TIGR03862 family flavoprotein [Hyphomicrobiaceae bacterium]|nr:TIGR03862 family flavoprotein [Hyphomicrobiaceae bacterium]MCC0010169.1 TIGR03862 family flavoprotein [Hyphomicrobiaceae bacterium]
MTHPGVGDHSPSTKAATTQPHVPATFDYDVAVVGAGPAGLFAAERLIADGLSVAIFEQMPSPARKLLMAGRGGLNLTHSEPLDDLLNRYHPADLRIRQAIKDFPPQRLVEWVHGLGIATFTGSSGRIFPQAMKASPLVRAWLARLGALGVKLHTRHRMTRLTAGTNAGNAPGVVALTFQNLNRPASPHVDQCTNQCAVNVTARAAVLALGGASWPKLGSDGAWSAQLSELGVPITPLIAANAGLRVSWSDHLVERYAGQPLKRIVLSIGGQSFPGELIVTRTGLEGGPAYACNRLVRDALAGGNSPVEIRLDLRPDLDQAILARRLEAPQGKQSFANHLRKRAGLTAVACALLREFAGAGPTRDGANACGSPSGKPSGLLPNRLAETIKSLPIMVVGLGGLERAISTAGGITESAIDDTFMLKRLPGVFAAGEMLDWEAPTGGYLLQATFATAAAAAKGASSTLAKTGHLPSTGEDG